MRLSARAFLPLVVAAIIVIADLASQRAEATFPGKNGKIAFVYFSPYLSTMNPNGTGHTRLIGDNGFPLEGSGPTWSPDGTRLAISCSHPVGGPPSLCTTDAEGKGKTFIDGDFSGPGGPTWSPDGTRLAYQDRGGLRADGAFSCCAVWAIDIDGTDQKMLSFYGRDPAWSPDGKKIAFWGGAAPSRFHTEDLYVMDADGSNVTQLTDTAIGHEAEPNWSPDSKKIVYSGSRVDTQAIPFEIWVINADGTGRERLTDSTFPFSTTVPVWSPDGKRIAFHGEGGINVMNADGSDRKALTLANRDLDWQPIPGPRRSDYKNAAHFCKAESEFWGEDFAERYGGGPNAFGKCVSGN